MSARITVSYETPDELRAILRKLNPLIDTFKLQPAKGKYKRAYLQMKTIHEGPENKESACHVPEHVV